MSYVLYLAGMSDMKATGGSEVKILILHVSGSKFSVLSPPFYGIQKFGSVGPKFPDLSGRVGAPEGHFSLFGAI